MKTILTRILIYIKNKLTEPTQTQLNDFIELEKRPLKNLEDKYLLEKLFNKD